MNAMRTVNSLSRLVELRARDVDRIAHDLASQQALRARYQSNLERMEELLDTVGATHAACPVLSSNCAEYKTSLVDLIAVHSNDLARHDASIDSSRRALTQAALKHESLDRVLQRKRQVLHDERQSREQKQQDQLATQAWFRARQDANGGVHPSRKVQS